MIYKILTFWISSLYMEKGLTDIFLIHRIFDFSFLDSLDNELAMILAPIHVFDIPYI